MTRRKTDQIILCIGMAACFSFCSQQALSQKVQTFADKRDIVIGEQVQYKIKATFPTGAFKVNWFSIPDSIAHFEVADRSKLDSSKDEGNTIYEQTIFFTSFDSGRWNTPGLPVSFEPVINGSSVNLFTDSIPINVSYSPPDSTNELRDIKPIINVSITDYTLYYIIGGIVLLLLLIFLLYMYFRKRKKLKPDVPVSKLSPYNEAIEEMKKLAQYNLQDPAGTKQYHNKLAEIFKRYLGRKQDRNLLTKTTGDLLIRMTESGMTAGKVSELATALRCTDAVKFAKYLPASAESEDCLEKIKISIDLIEHQTSNLSAGASAKADAKH
jgi:hypothetical protein